MAIWDEAKFWNSSVVTDPVEVSTQKERLNQFLTVNQFMKTINKTGIGAFEEQTSYNRGMSITDFMLLKKTAVYSENTARLPSGLTDAQAEEYASSVGILTIEEEKLLATINDQVSTKLMELYVNSYMSPMQSDIKWRLGDVTGIYMPSDEQYQHLIDKDGYMDTRSNFKPSLLTKFWNGARRTLDSSETYYTNFLFPPFKMGAGANLITDPATTFMIDGLPDWQRVFEDGTPNPNWNHHFDIDKFRIKKSGFTYREAGFKSVNDNINFLQWLLERATGLCPTYLTEWDLSLYMQEHMISTTHNGLTAHMKLDYRIRQDNPSGYDDDRALSYGVLNAAASKMGNNMKIWRPSDYPLSPYWMPYFRGDNPLSTTGIQQGHPRTAFHNLLVPNVDVKGNKLHSPHQTEFHNWVRSNYQFNGDPRDWYVEYYPMANEESGELDIVPYMSIYDEVLKFNNANTPAQSMAIRDPQYGSKDIRQIAKHMDFARMVLSGWHSMDMFYYQAIYTSEIDGMSEHDITMDEIVKSVQGMETVPKADELDVGMASIGEDQFTDMLAKGGYSGSDCPADMQSAGGAGSYKNKKADFLKWMIGKKKKPKGVDPNQATSSLGGSMANAGNAAASYFGDGPPAGKSPDEVAKWQEKKEAEGSTLGKYVGVNRFSPALFGGPFGSSYSPLTLQGYFEESNQFLRNTPRVSHNTAGDFTDNISLEHASGPESNAPGGKGPYHDNRKAASYYADVNKYYRHWSSHGGDQSPTGALGLMTHGSRFYTIAQARVLTRYDTTFEGTVSYRSRWNRKGCFFIHWDAYVGEPKPSATYWGLGWWSRVWYHRRYWDGYYIRDNNGNITYETDTRGNVIKDADGHPLPKIYAWADPNRQIRYYGNITTTSHTTWHRAGFWGLRRYNRWWGNWWSYHNDNGYHWYGKNGNQWGWFTTKTRAWRPGWYITWVIKQYKRYNLHADTNAQWRIAAHSFYTYDNPNHRTVIGRTHRTFWDTAAWALINRLRSSLGYRKTHQAIVRHNVLNRLILEDDERAGHRFSAMHLREKARMIQQDGTHRNYTKPLVFLQGDARYHNGTNTMPESIFAADSTSTQYPHLIWRVRWVREKFRWRRRSRRRWKAVWYQVVVWFPYIHVNITGPYGMRFFADKVNRAPFSNISRGSIEKPIQFDSLPAPHEAAMFTPDSDVLSKYAQTSYDFIATDAVNQSESHLFIRGRGILSQLPSLAPVVENSDYENFTADMSLEPSRWQDKPLESIEWKQLTLVGRNHRIQYNSDNEPVEVLDGLPNYIVGSFDNGLRQALTNLYSRSTFYPSEAYTSHGVMEWDRHGGTHHDRHRGLSGPLFISNDSGFRTLLSIAVQQQQYLRILKQLTFDELSFETIRKVLKNCVDKCVLKTNGFYEPDDPEEYAVADETHILYNYWLAELVRMVGDPEADDDRRQAVEDSWNERINSFNGAISILTPLCKKTAAKWTLADYRDAYGAVSQVRSLSSVVTNAEKFIMGYLNVLYQFRLYFIAKRFNKEDGTMFIMRALESILNFSCPSAPQNVGMDKPLSALNDVERAYKVAFSEVQNSTYVKAEAFRNGYVLDKDRVKTVYVRVNWTDKEEYDKWLQYQENPNRYDRVDEVVKIYTPYDQEKARGGRVRYAKKPVDDFYTLVSKEMIDHKNNVVFNNSYAEKILTGEITAKDIRVYDGTETQYDIAKWYIKWGELIEHKTIKDGISSAVNAWSIIDGRLEGTPIYWNVFAGVNTDKMLMYYEDGITPEELVCLCEEGADFWTVHVPEEMWPRAEGLKTKVFLKKFDAVDSELSLSEDAVAAVLGAQAYSLWPITEAQNSPIPAVMMPPNLQAQLVGSLGSGFMTDYAEEQLKKASAAKFI